MNSQTILEKRRARTKRWKDKNRLYVQIKERERWLRVNYNLSMDDYDRMVADQKGCCLICKEKKKLYVDHCHTTGKVRALLCNTCNMKVGVYELNKDHIEEYLGKFGYAKLVGDTLEGS